MDDDNLSLSTLMKSFSAQEEGYDESGDLLGGEIEQPGLVDDNVQQDESFVRTLFSSPEERTIVQVNAYELLGKFEAICQSSNDNSNGQMAFIDLEKKNGLIDDTANIEPHDLEVQ